MTRPTKAKAKGPRRDRVASVVKKKKPLVELSPPYNYKSDKKKPRTESASAKVKGPTEEEAYRFCKRLYGTNTPDEDAFDPQHVDDALKAMRYWHRKILAAHAPTKRKGLLRRKRGE